VGQKPQLFDQSQHPPLIEQVSSVVTTGTAQSAEESASHRCGSTAATLCVVRIDNVGISEQIARFVVHCTA
jgi:hypothetical protein